MGWGWEVKEAGQPLIDGQQGFLMLGHELEEVSFGVDGARHVDHVLSLPSRSLGY